MKRKEWCDEQCLQQQPIVDKVPVSLGWTPVSTESWHDVIMQVSKSNLSAARRSHSRAQLVYGMDLSIGEEAKCTPPGNS